MAAAAVPLKLKARALPADTLPPALRPGARAAGDKADEFLPPGYLQPIAAYDLGAVTRGESAATTETDRAAAEGEVLVLELADRSTFVTSAAKLREALERSRPDLIGSSGEILFDKLRTLGVAAGAAGTRGIVGDIVGALVDKVFRVGVDIAGDTIVQAAHNVAGDLIFDGLSWAGSKALMAAIESRLLAEPGSLMQWEGISGNDADLKPAAFPNGTPDEPLLVFIHGSASNTLGSFGGLRRGGQRDVWGALSDKFKGRIYAFEHRTFSESPIRNAIQLADALPARARLNLVTHSRGGIVGDLLCLADLEKHIAHYRQEVEQTGDRKDVSDRLQKEMSDAHAEQRADLAKLAALLQAKQFVIDRYVRVASPVAGTKLASANFDLFLSGLLSLIGTIPLFFGQPLYMAFKRIVIEIAKNRTNPRVVPGIEAMLPDAPMARLLREASPRPGITMSVIAGDLEGGNLLLRLGVLLTDFLLFDHDDHDLVVNTSSMLAGIAPACGARALFDRGPDVNHFSYFGNRDTGIGLRDGLLAESRKPSMRSRRCRSASTAWTRSKPKTSACAKSPAIAAAMPPICRWWWCCPA